MKALAIIIVSTLLHVAALVVSGTIIVAVCDFVVADSIMMAMISYPAWFFMGLYCGLLNYGNAGWRAFPNLNPDGTARPTYEGEWYSQEDSGKKGIMVILTTVAVLVAISIPCYRLFWQFNEPSLYVPMSFSHSITFLATLLATEIFAHTIMRPAIKRSEPRTG